MISQQEFHFDSPNVQDSFDMVLSQMVLEISHIGQYIHAN